MYEKSLKLNEKAAVSHAGLGVVLMTMYLETKEKNMDLRKDALTHWYRSLELDADQPRIQKLIDKYKFPPTTQPVPSL
jgi:hypothetical protein